VACVIIIFVPSVSRIPRDLETKLEIELQGVTLNPGSHHQQTNRGVTRS